MEEVEELSSPESPGPPGQQSRGELILHTVAAGGKGGRDEQLRHHPSPPTLATVARRGKGGVGVGLEGLIVRLTEPIVCVCVCVDHRTQACSDVRARLINAPPQ